LYQFTFYNRFFKRFLHKNAIPCSINSTQGIAALLEILKRHKNTQEKYKLLFNASEPKKTVHVLYLLALQACWFKAVRIWYLPSFCCLFL